MVVRPSSIGRRPLWTALEAPGIVAFSALVRSWESRIISSHCLHSPHPSGSPGKMPFVNFCDNHPARWIRYPVFRFTCQSLDLVIEGASTHLFPDTWLSVSALLRSPVWLTVSVCQMPFGPHTALPSPLGH